jgi:hypothetical protein
MFLPIHKKIRTFLSRTEVEEVVSPLRYPRLMFLSSQSGLAAIVPK